MTCKKGTETHAGVLGGGICRGDTSSISQLPESACCFTFSHPTLGQASTQLHSSSGAGCRPEFPLHQGFSLLNFGCLALQVNGGQEARVSLPVMPSTSRKAVFGAGSRMLQGLGSPGRLAPSWPIALEASRKGNKCPALGGPAHTLTC